MTLNLRLMCFRSPRWVIQLFRRHPQRFSVTILLLASLAMTLRYFFFEAMFHPRVDLLTQAAFWPGVSLNFCLLILQWFLWVFLLVGGLRAYRYTFAIITLICFGDLLAYFFAWDLKSFDRAIPLDYWYYWTYWMPTVLILANALILRRHWSIWCRLARRKRIRLFLNSFTLKSKRVKPVRLACLASFLCMGVVWILIDRILVTPVAVNVVDTIMFSQRSSDDLHYILNTSTCNGVGMKVILSHIVLSELTRKRFYSRLSDEMFRDFVLSPNIYYVPLNEMNWRIVLWRRFYPKIKSQTDPLIAAQIVARGLKESVCVDATRFRAVGIETTWVEQETDEVGFQMLYVASLRSVGIAARLTAETRVEFWTGEVWSNAPQVLVPLINSE